MEQPPSQAASQPMSAKRARQQSGLSVNDEKELIINDLLCYATKKLNQLRLQHLKQILCDFYRWEPINSAKEQLISDIDALNFDDWPKPPRRRLTNSQDTHEKIRIDVDDIVAMLCFIDQKQLASRLPRYVASDPDNIPSAKLTEGDMQCLLTKLHTLTAKVSELSESTAENNHKIAELSVRITTATTLPAQAIATDIARHPGVANSRHPIPTPRNSVSVDTDQGDLNDDDWDNDPSVQTVSRRKANKPPAKVLPGANQTTYASTAASGRVPPAQPNRPGQQARRTTMLGASQGLSNSLKAAKNLQIKKAVFKISNIDAGFNAENLVDHLTSMGVRVADDSRTHGKSCFELKPGPRQPEGNKSFRVCIFAADKPKLLIKEKWDSGIFIQEWIFHPKDPVIPPPQNGPDCGPVHSNSDPIQINAQELVQEKTLNPDLNCS